MADYGGATISLSQAAAQGASDDDDSSSDHIPAVTPKSGSAAASASTSSSKRTTTTTTNNNRITAIDHHNQIIHSTPENTPTNARKPRGRPPGSKNKPKPPIVVTRESDSVIKPVILEISAGADIIDSIITFARRNNAGISIISASGSVSSVTLRHPTVHVPALSLHGPFNLLSLSGTFLASYSNNSASSSSSSSSTSMSFGVTLAAAQGQVFGGILAGKLKAASPVVVVATTFVNPLFHMLPIGDEGDGEHRRQENKPEDGVGGGGGSSDHQPCSSVPMPVYGCGGGVASPTPLNCQVPPDIMHWGSRPPF